MNRTESRIAGEDARDRKELFEQGYRGSRFRFGYPACPNLADQEILLNLLDAKKIGIEMSEEHQLWPEQSTSALVCHHPSAKYFTIQRGVRSFGRVTCRRTHPRGSLSRG